MAQKVQNPNVAVSLIPAKPVPSVEPKVTTFVLQMTAGTATAGVKLVDIDINTEDTLFGANSAIATAIRKFRAKNEVSQINAIPLEDVAGTKAVGEIAVTGTATEAGSLSFSIGNDDRTYEIVIAVGDTATVIGGALVTAITADTKSLVTAINTTGTVATEAVNSGSIGNYIGIKTSGLVGGVAVALTGMSTGAGDPALTSIPALLTDRTDVITGIDLDYDLIVDDLDSKFNSQNVSLDGRCIISGVDTKANFVIIGDAENSKSLVIIPDKPVDAVDKKGSAIFAMPYEKTSAFQSVRALRVEKDQPLTGLITTTASRDQYGGAHLNSLPMFNCLMDLPVVPSGEGFTEEEASDLRDSGLSLLGNNRANNALISGAIYTTYKTNVAGQEDATYKFLNYVDTATACREFILNALTIDFAQSRLTSGSSVVGYDIVTKGRVASAMLGYMKTLGGDGYVLLQAGVLEDGRTIESIIDSNLVIDFDEIEGNIFISSILPIMVQVRSIVVPLSITFNVNEL
jgi:phage tail sheath gpL-like